MRERNLADLAQGDRHAELGLVDSLSGIHVAVRDEIQLKTHRAGRVRIRQRIAVPVSGRGVAEIVRFVSDGASMIVRRIPDLSQGQGAEAAGQSRIGKASACCLAGVLGADLVLKTVHRGEPVANFGRALDAPARAAVEELKVAAAAGLQSAAQRAVPGGLGENN